MRRPVIINVSGLVDSALHNHRNGAELGGSQGYFGTGFWRRTTLQCGGPGLLDSGRGVVATAGLNSELGKREMAIYNLDQADLGSMVTQLDPNIDPNLLNQIEAKLFSSSTTAEVQVGNYPPL